MRLVKPSWEIWEQEPGIQGIYKAIERAGRICYRSEDKITEDSAQPFVERMVKNGHGAMLEHGTVYLQIHWDDAIREEFDHIYCDYASNPYSKIIRKVQEDDLCPTLYVTTNYRVLVENDWLNDLKYLCEPTEFHEKRACVHFIADIGVLREFFRHRTMSMAQESTRFCSYNKDKFNSELVFIRPFWLNEDDTSYYLFIDALKQAELSYMNLIKGEARIIHQRSSKEQEVFTEKFDSWAAQQARAVLPLCTKSEAVMTGFVSDWRHFFELRCPANAHPQARELAIPLSEEFVKRKLIK